MTRFVTALPDATPLNVNTAPAELLAASIDGVEPAALATLLASRAQQPFQNIGDFRARLPQGASPIGPDSMYTVKSRYFLVSVRARQGDTVAQARALIDRAGSASAARRLANDRIAIAPPRISYTAPMLRVFLAAAPDRDRANPWVRYGADGRVASAGRDVPGRWPADAALEVVLAAAPVRLAVVDLPPMPRNRLRQAARFALEDQMAAGAEEAAIAVAPSGRPTIAAIASRALIDSVAAHDAARRPHRSRIGARATQSRMDVVRLRKRGQLRPPRGWQRVRRGRGARR